MGDLERRRNGPTGFRFRPELVIFAIVCLLAVSRPGHGNDFPKKMNIVLLISDDLNCKLGSYGETLAKTPHLDALAKKGVRFDRAYCQFPHCNPSRSSFLTGLRPRTTRVTNNEDSLYVNLPDAMTLPHWFRIHGYATARCGKIFHLGVPAGNESMDDPKAWDFGTPFRDERPYPRARLSVVEVSSGRSDNGRKAGFDWKEIEASDDDLVDGNFAKTAVEWLEKREPSKPFLLAVGFHRPHLPFVAPAPYYDLYPFDDIELRKEPIADDDDIPLPARNGAVPGYAIETTPEQRRAAIRAYLATVSYMDAQVGRVVAAVERLGLADQTVIVFMSDHGWHLGEHGLWHKRSLFEESARIPLIVYAPKAVGNGTASSSLVESLDLFPTLCDLTGIPAPPQLEGKSLRPLLADPQAIIHQAAITEARRGTHAEFWGRSVRTEHWRYTEWNGGRDGAELYDHRTDPHEFRNLAGDTQYSETMAELRAMLRERTLEPPSR